MGNWQVRQKPLTQALYAARALQVESGVQRLLQGVCVPVLRDSGLGTGLRFLNQTEARRALQFNFPSATFWLSRIEFWNSAWLVDFVDS